MDDNIHQSSVQEQISNSQLSALLYQNLALTNELLAQITTVKNMQDLKMQSIQHLLLNTNLIINHPGDYLHCEDPKTFSPLLTREVPGQQQLAPICDSGAFLSTINQDELRECSTSADHSENAQAADINIDMANLLSIKEASCSVPNFAIQLVRKYFKDDGPTNKNVSRTKGKKPLDP